MYLENKLRWNTKKQIFVEQIVSLHIAQNLKATLNIFALQVDQWVGWGRIMYYYLIVAFKFTLIFQIFQFNF